MHSKQNALHRNDVFSKTTSVNIQLQQIAAMNLVLLNQIEIFSIQLQSGNKICSLFIRPQTQWICTTI